MRANEGREISRTDDVDDRPQELWEVEEILDYGQAVFPRPACCGRSAAQPQRVNVEYNFYASLAEL